MSVTNSLMTRTTWQVHLQGIWQDCGPDDAAWWLCAMGVRVRLAGEGETA